MKNMRLCLYITGQVKKSIVFRLPLFLKAAYPVLLHVIFQFESSLTIRTRKFLQIKMLPDVVTVQVGHRRELVLTNCAVTRLIRNFSFCFNIFFDGNFAPLRTVRNLIIEVVGNWLKTRTARKFPALRTPANFRL